MNWIAFFSQTGSEIVNISKSLGIKPELIVTNNTTEEKWKYHPGIREMGVTILQARHDTLMNYFEQQRVHNEHNTIVTLHGYLRIIPPEVCKRYTIYNGHPAPIHVYPELKGKDKQEDLYKYKERYDRIGCVVHRVTPRLDDGEIIVYVDEPNTLVSIEDSYLKAKKLSLKSWEIFFNDYLPNKMLTR